MIFSYLVLLLEDDTSMPATNCMVGAIYLVDPHD